MPVTLRDFEGRWGSSFRHTNPFDATHPEVQGIWPPRARYYPPNDAIVLEGSITISKQTFYEYVHRAPPAPIPPQPDPDTREIIRFSIIDPTGQYDKDIISAVEAAEYHLIGDILVSTPMVVGGVAVTEFLSLEAGYTASDGSIKDIMWHKLLWSDGLQTLWPCCLL